MAETIDQDAVSVCLAAYEMGGYGDKLLDEALVALNAQTLSPYEIIIGDHSNDDSIEKVVARHAKISNLPLTYVKHFRGRGSQGYNLNRIARMASGDILMYLFQDDHLISREALAKVANGLKKSNAKWGKLSVVHTEDGASFYRYLRPELQPDLYIGKNTLSNQSGLFVRKKFELDFDENLRWYIDCEMFLRLFLTYSYPLIIEEPTISIRGHPTSLVRHPPSEEVLKQELEYYQKKILREYPNYLEWRRNFEKVK